MGYTQPEPLRGKHVLDGFSSNTPSLDDWLHRFARRAEADHTAHTFVTTENGEDVVGYYALATAAVAPADATRRLGAGQPSERFIPAMLIARLAVDKDHQGRGIGRSLLQNALLRCAEAEEIVAARAVVVNALDENAGRFYLHFGFEASPTDSLHLILLMKDLRKYLDSLS